MVSGRIAVAHRTLNSTSVLFCLTFTDAPEGVFYEGHNWGCPRWYIKIMEERMAELRNEFETCKDKEQAVKRLRVGWQERLTGKLVPYGWDSADFEPFGHVVTKEGFNYFCQQKTPSSPKSEIPT